MMIVINFEKNNYKKRDIVKGVLKIKIKNKIFLKSIEMEVRGSETIEKFHIFGDPSLENIFCSGKAIIFTSNHYKLMEEGINYLM
jgi:hypothetical protein